MVSACIRSYDLDLDSSPTGCVKYVKLQWFTSNGRDRLHPSGDVFCQRSELYGVEYISDNDFNSIGSDGCFPSAGSVIGKQCDEL